MDSEQLRAHLAQAERHVAECRGHSARQRQVVEQLSLKDESREEAVVMLTILEDSLRILEQHRACAASRSAVQPHVSNEAVGSGIELVQPESQNRFCRPLG
jgi:hypothetical protein